LKNISTDRNNKHLKIGTGNFTFDEKSNIPINAKAYATYGIQNKNISNKRMYNYQTTSTYENLTKHQGSQHKCYKTHDKIATL
jgi:hypothetical protein